MANELNRKIEIPEIMEALERSMVKALATVSIDVSIDDLLGKVN
jgi:hypothetical protein